LGVDSTAFADLELAQSGHAGGARLRNPRICMPRMGQARANRIMLTQSALAARDPSTSHEASS
jgi:hypothetical protein